MHLAAALGLTFVDVDLRDGLAGILMNGNSVDVNLGRR
jgi:hypothetical protein